MANDCESKFRIVLNKKFPNGFINKIPDFKQTGSSGARGLPDYMVISHGTTFWYEVKKVNSKKTFPFSALRESQWIVFTEMMRAGAMITIAVYMKGTLYQFSYNKLFEHFLFVKSRGLSTKSVSIEELL